jgi:galactokinase
MIETLFRETFGTSAPVTNFTPGRVNLIGEHTDYNGGWVLPTALTLGVSLAIAPRSDGRIRIRSDKFEGLAERRMDDHAADHWSDYIVGALQLARAEGFGPNGADVAVMTTLPFGAGISSSAAVTVGILRCARDLTDQDRSNTEIAVLARKIENDFIGMPCGIMDQMAVAISSPGQALSLDTKSLNYALIDLPKTHHMAVIHSGVFRQLNEGRYKIRKEECDAVKAALGHDDLCLTSDAELASLSTLAPAMIRRARHCQSEHRRTVLATDALQAKRMTEFGQLMNDSHASMRDDFEITVPAVDALVADAQRLGATGARMTGGGFGGCIVACVEQDRLPDWRGRLLCAHPAAFWVC